MRKVARPMDDVRSTVPDNAFGSKVKRFARLLGMRALQKVFELYGVSRSGQTPTWAKAVSWAALAYFISPIDAVPDFLPVVGFSDDLLAAGAALMTLAKFVSPELIDQARLKAESVLGDRTKPA